MITLQDTRTQSGSVFEITASTQSDLIFPAESNVTFVDQTIQNIAKVSELNLKYTLINFTGNINLANLAGNKFRSSISGHTIQTFTGDENNLHLTVTLEDLDDPEYLSANEIKQIEASLSDYASGKFKEGSLEALLNDLDNH